MAPTGGLQPSRTVGAAGRDWDDGPTVARVHDAFLGGKEPYAIDRAVAARLRQVSHGLETGARAARAFAQRGVAALAAAGVDQFIDLGCGYPSGPNMHEIAQRHCPGARVVYADNDTGVLVHARALLGGFDGVGVAFGEAHDVHDLLTHPMVTRVIKLERPVGVLLIHLLEFLDDPTAARLLDALSSVLPSGSPVLVTHTSPDLLPSAEADNLIEAASLYSGFVAPYRLRSLRAVADLLYDYTFVPPGLGPVENAWKSMRTAKEHGTSDAVPVVAAIVSAGSSRVGHRREEVMPSAPDVGH